VEDNGINLGGPVKENQNMESETLINLTSRHLKLDMTSEEYKALWDQFAIPQFKTSDGTQLRPHMKITEDWYMYEENKIALEFWRHIPNYITARCPLCGEVYSERMDTYSLEDWGMKLDSSFFCGWHLVDEESASFEPVRCKHFLGVEGFINFNGLEPIELDPSYYSGPAEVPSVMGVFLPDDPCSYAVVHSLPICRVENGKFIPRYSLFMMTYFSEDTHFLLGRNQSHYNENMGVITSLMIDLSSSRDYDLCHWVADGKLLWLDLEQDDLPLKSGPPEAFPYADIHGSRIKVRYRGKNHPKGYHAI
jgi:hypothetical protein